MYTTLLKERKRTNMSTTINVRIDKEDKYCVDAICKKLGLTLSSAVNTFFKAMIREKGLPFELKIYEPNSKTIAALEEAKAIVKNKNIKKYKNVAELRKALNV